MTIHQIKLNLEHWSHLHMPESDMLTASTELVWGQSILSVHPECLGEQDSRTLNATHEVASTQKSGPKLMYDIQDLFEASKRAR